MILKQRVVELEMRIKLLREVGLHEV